MLVFRYNFDDNLQKEQIKKTKVFIKHKYFFETVIDLKCYILFEIGKFNSFHTQDF